MVSRPTALRDIKRARVGGRKGVVQLHRGRVRGYAERNKVNVTQSDIDFL
jgi:hypothetical protein